MYVGVAVAVAVVLGHLLFGVLVFLFISSRSDVLFCFFLSPSTETLLQSGPSLVQELMSRSMQFHYIPVTRFS